MYVNGLQTLCQVLKVLVFLPVPLFTPHRDLFVLLPIKNVVSLKKAKKNVVKDSNVFGPRTFQDLLVFASKSLENPFARLTTKRVEFQQKANKNVVTATPVNSILNSLVERVYARLKRKSMFSIDWFVLPKDNNVDLHGKVRKNVVPAPVVWPQATLWVLLEFARQMSVRAYYVLPTVQTVVLKKKVN